MTPTSSWRSRQRYARWPDPLWLAALARANSAMGLSGILCAGPGYPSRLDEPFVEHDGELGLCFEPLARGHLPLSSGAAQDQKQQLCRGFVGRKMASRAHGAT